MAKEKIEARVLAACVIDGNPHKADDVVSVDAALLKAHTGELDADPAAVKYAKSLKKAAAKAEEGEE